MAAAGEVASATERGEALRALAAAAAEVGDRGADVLGGVRLHLCDLALAMN